MQANLEEQITDARRPFTLRQHARVYGPRFGDDLRDRHAWVQGGKGVLEDHLHFAAKVQEMATREAEDALSRWNAVDEEGRPPQSSSL